MLLFRARKEGIMKLITLKLPSNHNQFFFGDLHEGSILFSESGWNEFVKCLRGPYEGCYNNYACGGGDLMEAIMINDRRADAQKMQEPFVSYQIATTTERMKGIADVLNYLLDGNHETYLWRYGPIIKKMCDDISTPEHTVHYGTVTAKMTVLNTKGKLMYKIFDTHGRKGVNSAADDPLRRDVNLQLILKRHLRRKAADCAVMIKHHVHKLIVTPPTKELILMDDGTKIQQGYTALNQRDAYIHPDMRWYGCAGSFMRLYRDGYSGYAEVAEYDPVELGWLVLIIRDGKIVELKKHYIRKE